MLIMFNIYWMQYIGPVVWLALMVVGLLYFKYAERHKGSIVNKIPKVADKTLPGTITRANHLCAALTIIGIIFSLLSDTNLSALAYGLIITGDILATILVGSYISVLIKINHAVKNRDKKVLKNLPLMPYEGSLLLALALQALVFYAFIIPSLRATF